MTKELINPQRTKSASKIPSFRKTVIKYNLEEYFGINVQMKVIDLDFFTLSIWLDITNILLCNLKLKSSNFFSNFDYKQNINLFGVRFVGVGLKYNTFDVLIFPIPFVA
jgi:hypothetical protein